MVVGMPYLMDNCKTDVVRQPAAYSSSGPRSEGRTGGHAEEPEGSFKPGCELAEHGYCRKLRFLDGGIVKARGSKDEKVDLFKYIILHLQTVYG